MSRRWSLVLATSLAAGTFLGLPAQAHLDPPDAQLPLPLVGIVAIPDLSSGGRADAAPSKPRYTAPSGWTCTDHWDPDRGVYRVTCTPDGGAIRCSRMGVTVDARGSSGTLEGWSHCQAGLAYGAYARTPAPGQNSGSQPVNDTTPWTCVARETGKPRPWTVTCTLE